MNKQEKEAKITAEAVIAQEAKDIRDAKKAELDAHNAKIQDFKDWKLAQSAKVEIAIVERQKSKQPRTANVWTFKNQILAYILKAGEKGLLVSEMLEIIPIHKPAEGKKVKVNFSVDTLGRDWNVKTISGGHVQAEEKRLQDKVELMVGFNVETDTEFKGDNNMKRGHNNRITIDFGAETLKEYLLSKNTPSDFFDEDYEVEL